jgi:hypothetical protein
MTSQNMVIYWFSRSSCVVWLYAVMTALPLAAQPVIRAQAGVVNAASYSSPGLPNSGIAQGSVFVVIGTNLGPASTVNANFPPVAGSGGNVGPVDDQRRHGSVASALYVGDSSGHAVAVIYSYRQRHDNGHL